MNIISFIVLVFVLITKPALADFNVRINEFLIEPFQKVELINTGSDPIDITGWFIDDSGGSTFFTIPEMIIPPNSCSVFESDFNLNKSSTDIIRLFNNTALPTSSSAMLVDSFSYKSSSGSGISFKRIPDGVGLWATGSADFGFFNNSINSCVIAPTSSPTPTPIVTLSPTPAITTLVENIYISEIMVNPQTGEKEWVELYNNNDFGAALIRWSIDDTEDGGSSPKSLTITIPSHGYSVIELGSSLFNNDGDSIRLLDTAEIEKDKFDYLYSEKGKTWGRTSFDTKIYCLQEPTYGLANGPCIVTTTTTPLMDQKIKPLSVKSKPLPSKITGQKSSSSKVLKNKMSAPKVKPEQIQGEILGEQSISSETQKPKFSRTLSTLSFSYSLLTIVSIFLKMKMSI